MSGYLIGFSAYYLAGVAMLLLRLKVNERKDGETVADVVNRVVQDGGWDAELFEQDVALIGAIGATCAVLLGAFVWPLSIPALARKLRQ